jgi:hypothetical protein
MEKETRSIALIAVGLLLVAGAVGGWWYYSRRPAPAAPAARAVTGTEAPITRTAPAPELPPLDHMDAMVRSLLGALSTRPDLVKWLATDNLLNQTALALDLASQGKSPAKDFKLLAPVGSFAVAQRSGRRTLDPASYRRYNGLVTTLTSLDASAVGRAYKTVKPRLDEAYRKNGHPNGDIDSALNSALDLLLDTPLIDDPVALKEGEGARWAFADTDIESLQPIQKQLLRMGPDNVDKILVWLRAFQSALKP